MATIRKNTHTHTHKKHTRVTQTHTAQTTDCLHVHTHHKHNASPFSSLTIKTGMISVWEKNCQSGCSLGDLIGGEEEEQREGEGERGGRRHEDKKRERE